MACATEQKAYPPCLEGPALNYSTILNVTSEKRPMSINHAFSKEHIPCLEGPIMKSSTIFNVWCICNTTSVISTDLWACWHISFLLTCRCLHAHTQSCDYDKKIPLRGVAWMTSREQDQKERSCRKLRAYKAAGLTPKIIQFSLLLWAKSSLLLSPKLVQAAPVGGTHASSPLVPTELLSKLWVDAACAERSQLYVCRAAFAAQGLIFGIKVHCLFQYKLESLC